MDYTTCRLGGPTTPFKISGGEVVMLPDTSAELVAAMIRAGYKVEDHRVDLSEQLHELQNESTQVMRSQLKSDNSPNMM